jgi:hypothetical protein
MSIKFFCSCGKHLRAREALAGKRSLCPACGKLVGVPSLQPTQRGTVAAPISPAERAKLGRYGEAWEAESAAATATATESPPGTESADGRDASPKPRRRPRRDMALEKHWYECLLFPFYAWRLLLPLAAAMTALTGVGALAWPELGSIQAPPWQVWLVCWAAPFLALSYACGYLQCVLASAAAGDVGFVRWPGADLRILIRALAAWTLCFLAGPVVFAVIAVWFWIHAGDPTWVDWSIIAELWIIALTHWLLTLVAVHQGDRLRDANPVRVGDVIRRLGYRVVAATVGAAGISLLLGLLITDALPMVHEDSVQGWFFLVLGWLGALAWLTFFFRLLGLWCFQSRVEACNIPV